MGGLLSLGAGISGLANIISAGSTAQTALQEAFLTQQYQQQEQNTVLEMGLSQMQNQQLQTSLIGQNVNAIFGLQQKTQEEYFKTTAKVANGWMQALGGSRG